MVHEQLSAAIRLLDHDCAVCAATELLEVLDVGPCRSAGATLPAIFTVCGYGVYLSTQLPASQRHSNGGLYYQRTSPPRQIYRRHEHGALNVTATAS